MSNSPLAAQFKLHVCMCVIADVVLYIKATKVFQLHVLDLIKVYTTHTYKSHNGVVKLLPEFGSVPT